MNANRTPDRKESTVERIPVFHPHRYRTARNLSAFAGLADDSVAARDPNNGWLFYDETCPFCTRVATTIESPLRRRHLYVLPLQTAWVQKLLAERHEPLLKEIRFLAPDGKLFGGADALIEVARCIWWTRPLAWLGRIPIIRLLLRRSYDFVATHRHCLKAKNSLLSGHGLRFRFGLPRLARK